MPTWYMCVAQCTKEAQIAPLSKISKNGDSGHSGDIFIMLHGFNRISIRGLELELMMSNEEV